jgi:drug/metabolite transporter (DMT)-like permease
VIRKSKLSAPWVGVLLVNVATLSWATNIILGRWLRNDIGPLTLAAFRFSIGSALYLVLLSRRPPAERRLGGDGWRLLGMGITGVVLFSPGLYLALRFTTSVNATLIQGLGPLITGLFAALLIQEAMTRRQVAGAVVGLIGVVVLISGGSVVFFRTMGANPGDLIMIFAVAVWALYSILSCLVTRTRSALSATAISTFMGLPILIVAALWESRTMGLTLTLPLVLAIVYIGIVPTVAGFLSWNEGVRRLGPSGAMVFFNTLPLYGAILGVVILGEPVTVATVVGGLLIVGGGLWAARGRSGSA